MTSDMPAPTDPVDLPRVAFTDRSGNTIVVDAHVDESVMQTAKRQGIPGIRGDCGGFMMCATCHVYVDERDFARLPPLTEDEDEMLDETASPRLSCSRLSCQLSIASDSDLHVSLPDRQL